MKRLLLIPFLLLAIANGVAQLGSPAFPTATPANPSLTNTTFPYVATSGACSWISTHFDLASGSAVACAGPGNAVFTNYIDALDYITWWYKAIQAYCDSAGITNCNDKVLLHVKRDYYSSAPWTALSGAFDWGENTSTGNIAITQAVHGAFVHSGSVYTDVTCPLYGDGVHCTSRVFIGDTNTLYLGFFQPFDRANFVMGTPAGAGTTLVWEYSTGSGGWSTLAVTDGTSNFTQNGLVTFTPPSNWSRDIVSGSKSKYWIRVTPSMFAPASFISVRNTDAAGIPAMLTNSACSDCGGHVANMRGWDEAAWAASTACGGSPCTTDGIPYNPNPPSTCPGASTCRTARFPYQGAGNFYGGGPDRFWPNPDTFNGTVSAANNIMAQQLAFKDSISGIIGTNYNGVMQDNVGSIGAANATTPAMSSLISQMDLHCGSSCTIANVQTDEGSGGVYGYLPAWTEAATQVAAAHGAGFVVAWNNSAPSATGQTAPVYYNEFANRAVHEPRNIPWQAFDDTLASTNTLGSIMYAQFIDGTKYSNLQDPGFSTIWHIFDSDRGSMDAIAEFYLADAWCPARKSTCFTSPPDYTYNYTGYLFDTSTSASYFTTDEVGQYQTLSTLTSAISPSPFGVPVSFTVTNDSLLRPVGGPYFATAYQLRLCPTPTTCNDGDKIAVTRTSSNHFTTTNPAGGSVPPILHSYTIGSTVQFAQTVTLHTLGTFPDWKTIGAWWSLWHPVLGFDIGKPDPAGYNGGIRSCGTVCATTLLPSPPAVFKSGTNITCIGHAGLDGCSASAPAACAAGTTHGDIYRRDFINGSGQQAIVLVRDYGYQYCTDDFDWASRNLDMSSANSSCAPNCSYQRVHSDATLDAATSIFNLRAGESAILVRSASPAAPSLYINSLLVRGLQVN